ncbi:MAG: stage III sporulation protein AF [Thermoanaerobacteraceae bacterium]|nr:stage III sporulation protein AF [Thermoanaerobacteraceae bacterium]
METVRNLVQNLIVIVVLAVFLEMLLPAGEMRRYIKMVMGLLVIVAVLQAIGGVVRGEWRLELPEPALNSPSPGMPGLADIMAGGRQLSSGQQEKALQEYRQGLARQVRALAGLQGQVTVQGVEVEVYTDPKDQRYGQVREIRLLLAAGPSGNGAGEKGPPVVEPVTVDIGSRGAGGGPEGGKGAGGSGTPAPEVERAARKLAATLANFYNLPVDSVKIEFGG